MPGGPARYRAVRDFLTKGHTIACRKFIETRFHTLDSTEWGRLEAVLKDFRPRSKIASSNQLAPVPIVRIPPANPHPPTSCPADVPRIPPVNPHPPTSCASMDVPRIPPVNPHPPTSCPPTDASHTVLVTVLMICVCFSVVGSVAQDRRRDEARWRR